MLYIQQKILRPEAKKLVRSSAHACGYDIATPEPFVLNPFERKLVKVGFSTAFTKGWVGLICDRSGMGNKGITRFAGVIDPDYRDEWGVILWNSNPFGLSFGLGDRIAQVLFFEVGQVEVTEVDTLEDSDSDRTGGFGSTGR